MAIRMDHWHQTTRHFQLFTTILMFLVKCGGGTLPLNLGFNMKLMTWLPILLWLRMVTELSAATPSFSSFFTNHFTTNGYIIKSKLSSQFDASATNITITNISGVANGLWTTNNQAYIRPVILTNFSPQNVKWYGAAGNGSDDDTLAIQSAINVGLGTGVYLPPGTYLISGGLTNVSVLYGESPLTTVITNTGGTGNMITSVRGSPYIDNLFMANFQLSGNGTANGIHVEDALRNRLSNIFITNCVDGLNLTNAYITYVDGCRFDWCTNKAIRLGSGSGHMIKATTIEQCGTAIHFDQESNALFVDGCVIEGNYWGIDIPNLAIRSCTIQGTFFEKNRYGDIVVGTHGSTTTPGPVNVIGCEFALGGATTNLYFEAATQLTCIGNRFGAGAEFRAGVQSLVLQQNYYTGAKDVITTEVVDMDGPGTVVFGDVTPMDYRSIHFNRDAWIGRVGTNSLLTTANFTVGQSTNTSENLAISRAVSTNSSNNLNFQNNLTNSFTLFQPPASDDLVFSRDGTAAGERARFVVTENKFRVGNVTGTNVANNLSVSRLVSTNDSNNMLWESAAVVGKAISQFPGSDDLVFSNDGTAATEVFRVDSGGIRVRTNTFLGTWTGMPNGASLWGRNAADAAYVNLITIDALDRVSISQNAYPVLLNDNTTITGDGSSLTLAPETVDFASNLAFQTALGGSGRGYIGYNTGATNMDVVASIGSIDFNSPYEFNYWLTTNKVLTLGGTVANEGQITFGPGASNLLYRATSDLIYKNTDESSPAFIVMNKTNSTISLAVDGIGTSGQLNTSMPILGLGNSGAMLWLDGTNAYPNVASGMNLGTSSNPFYNLDLTGQIIFGPGTTNVLYRSGADVIYTNGASSTRLQIVNGTGRVTSVGSDTAGSFLNTTGIGSSWGVSGQTIYNNSSYAAMFPSVDNAVDFGRLLNNIKAVQSRTNFVYGYHDAAIDTNYSRVTYSHGGTNSTANINSEGSGIAGTGRPLQFQIDSTNVFRISYENWVDSMVPASAIRPGAVAPTLSPFGPGGVAQVYFFDNNQDDEVEFSIQLNHNMIQGDPTGISPHLHWAETAATGAGTNCVFELAYTWANVNEAFGAYATNRITNAISGTLWKHQLAEFPHIIKTNSTVSSILVCRVRRLANSATADDYDQGCAILGFDCHYRIDSPGSDSEASKSF